MNGPMRQHGRTTGCQVWQVIAVAIGLAMGSQAVAAKECHRETPLPSDVRLIVPGPEVTEAVAQFAGAWTGEWEHCPDGQAETGPGVSRRAVPLGAWGSAAL